MAIRNFYLRGYVDGRETSIGFGPRRKDGGMNLELLVRNSGTPESLFKIYCFVNKEDMLVVRLVDTKTGDVVYEVEKYR